MKFSFDFAHFTAMLLGGDRPYPSMTRIDNLDRAELAAMLRQYLTLPVLIRNLIHETRINKTYVRRFNSALSVVYVYMFGAPDDVTLNISVSPLYHAFHCAGVMSLALYLSLGFSNMAVAKKLFEDAVMNSELALT